MVFWMFAALSLYMGARLAKVQVKDCDYYRERANAQHLGRAELPALRGEIRDRNNVVLATSIALWSVAANPDEARGKAAEIAAELAPILNLRVSVVEEALTRPGTFTWLARKVEDDVVAEIKEKKLPGIFVLKEPTPGRRYYPKGRLFSHLLGATGIDDQGLDGLEGAYEHHLAGTPGLIRAFMDRDGWATVNQGAALTRPATPGHNVILTVDETIQYVAEKELAKQVKEYHAKGGIVVAMDVRTGEILAMAINPDFPAKDFSKVEPKVRRNRAITDPYEPGSTFKVFLAGAALNSGMRPGDMFRSGGVLSIGGWTIHNASDGLYAGHMETIADIIKYSFNVGTTSMALAMGKKVYWEHLDAFGLTKPTGIDLVGEGESLLAHYKDWAEINTATISFGQGVAVTPIQLVSAMQAVANGGVRMKPRVVKAIVDHQGQVVERFDPEEVGRPISPEAARDLVKILEGVVEGGTGKKAQIPGYRAAGKTGTAQMSENGVYAPGKYIASFLGFAPADNPRVAILVKIEEPNPYWGGLVAGPVFSRVAEKALWKLGIQPDPELLKKAKGKRTNDGG